MTSNARGILSAFDALEPDDKREVIAEILRRATASGDLPDEAFVQLAAEVFRGYDAEEASNGERPAR